MSNRACLLSLLMIPLLLPVLAHADYWVSTSGVANDVAGWEKSSGASWSDWEGCKQFWDDGVVRSFYAYEINRADYEKARIFCREMQGTVQGVGSSLGSLASILGLLGGGVLVSRLGPEAFLVAAGAIYVVALIGPRLWSLERRECPAK